MDRQGRLLTLLFIGTLTFTLVAACGTKQKDRSGVRRWASFPVPIYADSDVDGDAAKRADLMSAMSFWEQRAGRRLFDYRGAMNERSAYAGSPGSPTAIHANVFFVLNPWEYSTNVAAQTMVLSSGEQIVGSIVMVNPDITVCPGQCAGAPSQLKIFAHELGHFLGLGHAASTSDLMYPEALPGSDLSSVTVDAGALMALTN